MHCRAELPVQRPGHAQCAVWTWKAPWSWSGWSGHDLAEVAFHPALKTSPENNIEWGNEVKLQIITDNYRVLREGEMREFFFFWLHVSTPHRTHLLCLYMFWEQNKCSRPKSVYSRTLQSTDFFLHWTNTNQFLSLCTCTCLLGPPSGGRLRGWSPLCPHPGQTLTGPPLEREHKFLLCPETCWFVSPDMNGKPRFDSVRGTKSAKIPWCCPEPHTSQNQLSLILSGKRTQIFALPWNPFSQTSTGNPGLGVSETLILFNTPMLARTPCKPESGNPLEFPLPQMFTFNVAKISLHLTRFCLKRKNVVSELYLGMSYLSVKETKICNLLNRLCAGFRKENPYRFLSDPSPFDKLPDVAQFRIQEGPGLPPCLQDFFKIMQFSDNFKGRTLYWANFGLRAAPLGVKTPLGLPDQNPGFAPVGIKFVYPTRTLRIDHGSSHHWCVRWSTLCL